MKKVALLLDLAEVPQTADLQPLWEGTLAKMRNFTDEVVIHTRSLVFDGVTTVHFEMAHAFLKWCMELESDTVLIILNAYATLFDTQALERMLREHEHSLYDYTYPENLPAGSVPELFTAEVARFILPTLPEKFPMFRKSIRELFESDISSYDTNLFVHPGRLIRHRVELIPSSFYNYRTLIALRDAFGDDPGIDDLEEGILQQPEIVRTYPTYYEIELTTEAESGAFFAGSLVERTGEMKLDDLRQLLKDIVNLSYNPMVVFGLYGEPFLYSDFDGLVEELKHYPFIQFVFESRGITFSAENVEQVLKLENVDIIFDMSFSDVTLFDAYKKPKNPMLPFEGYHNLRENILSLPQKDRVYLQYTRSKVNENGILKFYEDWSEFKDRILIKKPDCLSGRLTQFRVVDLSPVERFACLHLKHDMVILFDGFVPLCRQDVFVSEVIGNAFRDGVESCWKAMGDFYQKQCRLDWIKPQICNKCDEWWIFNH